jgi:hypothetical protein
VVAVAARSKAAVMSDAIGSDWSGVSEHYLMWFDSIEKQLENDRVSSEEC